MTPAEEANLRIEAQGVELPSESLDWIQAKIRESDGNLVDLSGLEDSFELHVKANRIEGDVKVLFLAAKQAHHALSRVDEMGNFVLDDEELKNDAFHQSPSLGVLMKYMMRLRLGT